MAHTLIENHSRSRMTAVAITTVRRAFIALAVGWAMLVPAATFAASRQAARSESGAILSWVVYRIGAVICHQRPERSFSVFSTQMPVCARCAGIYAGAALMAAGVLLRTERAHRNAARSIIDPRTVMLWAVLPAAATLVYEWTAGQMPGHWLRAASGLPIGVAVAWIVCCAATARSEVM
jgi:uncharacterized membrane protein